MNRQPQLVRAWKRYNWDRNQDRAKVVRAHFRNELRSETFGAVTNMWLESGDDDSIDYDFQGAYLVDVHGQIRDEKAYHSHLIELYEESVQPSC